ncbi:MAG: RHS repeat domain-containing protein [Syntrophobacteraceae bacterium]
MIKRMLTPCKMQSVPLLGEWSYLFNADGNLGHQTYRRSPTEDITISFEYDTLNRPVNKSYPDPAVQADVQYFYDEAGRVSGKGRLTGVIDASGQSFFDYDYAGRVTASTTRVNIGGQLTDPYTLNRTYDALGRISSITYPAPDNETIQYGYDNNGNLDSVTRVGGACYAAFSAYNAAGQPGNIQFYNGASTLLEYYPSNNRLKSVTTNANGLVQEIRYTAYDKNGNVKSIEDGSEAVKTYAYGYDGLNRLRTADSSAYSGINPIDLDYAGVGNIWKNSITGTDTFPAERELVYDYDNRLAAINTDSGMTTFAYNYQGERVIKQSGNSTTIYIGGLFEEKDGERIKHLFAGDRRIVSRIGSAAYYYHPDHLGGLSVITNSGGDVAQKAAYYPFGQQIDPGVETDPLPYRFTGQELDTETGLYYYKSRYYDPMIGRFISPDPLIQAAFDPPSFPRLIGFDYLPKEPPVYNQASIAAVGGKTMNAYPYAANNPINATDPVGLRPLFDNEKAYLRYYFGSNLNVDRIDLKVSFFGNAWSPFGNRISLPVKYFNSSGDLNLDDALVSCRFVHEAGHVWQRQRGMSVTASAIPEQLSGKAYEYQKSANPLMMLHTFTNGKVEQQGQMLEDMDFFYRMNKIGPFDSMALGNEIIGWNPYSQIRSYMGMEDIDPGFYSWQGELSIKDFFAGF